MAKEKKFVFKLDGVDRAIQEGQSLKSVLKGMEDQMATMAVNGVKKTDENFVALAKKAGQLRDAIKDAKDEVNRFASDTKKLDDVVGVAKDMTAAFQLYSGAMAAFGADTEETEKQIKNLMATMSMLQSLQQISQSLQNGSATARLFSQAMKVLGVESAKTQLSLAKAAISNQELTVAQKAGTVATKLFSAALKAIPLMLVIGLIAELIANWKEVDKWLTRLIPGLGEFGSVMDTVKAYAISLGRAVLNWVINPFKTLVKTVSSLVTGDFKGAFQAIEEGIRNQFAGTIEAFNKEMTNQRRKAADERIAIAAEESNKETEFQRQMLEAKKGADAKYSKEGIELFKKSIEERRKIARGDKDKLRELDIEEARFYRECQERKTKDAKTNSQARIKQAQDEAKEIAEYNKKLASSSQELVSALNSYFSERQKSRITKIQDELNLLERLGKLTDEYKEERQLDISYFKSEDAVINLSEAGEKLIIKYRELIDMAIGLNKDLDDELFNVEKDDYKEVDKFFAHVHNTVVDGYSQLTEEQKKQYYLYVTELKTALYNAKELVLQYNNEIHNISNEDEKNRIDNLINHLDKQVELQQQNADEIQVLFDNTLNHIDKNVRQFKGPWDYIFNSKKIKENQEYLVNSFDYAISQIEAKNKKIEEDFAAYSKTMIEAGLDGTEEYKQRMEEFQKIMLQNWNILQQLKEAKAKVEVELDIHDKLGNGVTPEDWFGFTKDGFDWEKFIQNSTRLVGEVSDSIFSTIDMAIEAHLEQARDYLDEVTDMYDEAVDMVGKSESKLSEIETKMANASGAELDRLREQQAEERILLTQRLADERALAIEKERMEKHVKDLERKQKKNEAKANLVQAVINTALGVTQALKAYPWPISGIMAALQSAMGAVQIGIIKSNMSKLAEGGLLEGPLHSQGGIPVGATGIEVEGGEYVVNRASTSKYLPLVEAINADNPIQVMAAATQLSPDFQSIDSSLSSTNKSNQISDSILGIDMHPVVSVVDINRGQRNLTTVRDLAGASHR